jgi:asparagine synthase (glutamine-hydrolysing)
MNKPTEVLALGSPLFTDAALAQTERERGVEAAWQQAVARSPAEAATTARGHFAVGMRNVGGAAFLAVDRFATQTLCFSNGAGELRFSERADELAGASPEIDTQALFDYLYFHAIPSPRTVFRGVQRLPPGHYAAGRDGHWSVGRYWRPGFSEVPTAFEPARARFLDLLAKAVETQLDGTRPACFLSGGTDSSTIAGMISRVAGQPAASYSIGFEAEGYDEMEYARIAARRFGTEHHEYYVTPDDLVRGIPLLAAHLDQPFGNSSALPAYMCALRAREDGVTRLLAGDGGDELFGGNTRYATQRVFSWYQSIPEGLRRQLLEPISAGGALDRLPLLRKGASYVRQARVPMPQRLQTYNLLHRLGEAEVLTPQFLASVDTGGPDQHQQAVWQEQPGQHLVNQMLAFDWRYTLAENDLPKVRNATQLAGVSVGYPFLDQAVLEFSEQLPVDFKLKGLKLRWFFKEALRGFLPDEIITKKKHGFGLPFGVWATRNEGLKSLARDSVRGLGERGIVRREFTDTLVDRHLPEHPGYYGEMVWILMMLEQWFRHHAPNYRLQA